MRTQGSKEFWLEALRMDSGAFQAVAHDIDLSARVPTCPDWTVLDLVRHLGAAYRWVRSHVSRGTTSRPERMVKDWQDLPDPEQTLVWFDSQRRDLLQLLDALDPHLPAWNWAPRPKTAEFWHRRMAHETAVHRWDLQMAQGMAEPIAPKLASDGVTEVLDSWLPAGRRTGPTDQYGVVRLSAVDVGQDWYLRLRGEGVALLDTDTLLDDDQPSRISASGNASDLLLALWGRVGFDTLETGGDTALLHALRVG